MKNVVDRVDKYSCDRRAEDFSGAVDWCAIKGVDLILFIFYQCCRF